MKLEDLVFNSWCSLRTALFEVKSERLKVSVQQRPFDKLGKYV